LIADNYYRPDVYRSFESWIDEGEDGVVWPEEERARRETEKKGLRKDKVRFEGRKESGSIHRMKVGEA